MSRAVLLAFLALVLVELSQCKVKNYDNFDMESVLSNPERAKKFFECARNDDACSKEDKEMKLDLMEMLSTGCTNCTQTEKTKLEAAKRRAMNDPAIMQLVLGDNPTYTLIDMYKKKLKTPKSVLEFKEMTHEISQDVAAVPPETYLKIFQYNMGEMAEKAAESKSVKEYKQFTREIKHKPAESYLKEFENIMHKIVRKTTQTVNSINEKYHISKTLSSYINT